MDNRHCWVPTVVTTPDGQTVYEEANGTECDNPLAVEQPPPVDKPPSSGESAESLGAPAPPSQSPPADNPNPSLAHQYYRPGDPEPDYSIADQAREQLTAAGTPPEELEDETAKILQSVIRNEPPDKMPHPFFSQNDRQALDTVVDPVIIATGQYSLSLVEVEIPSRGFPIRLTRFYRSGPVYFGPWGFNWDHNYNVYLRELADGSIAIWTGELREDVYKALPGVRFESPAGCFRKLEFQLASGSDPDRYVLSDREGMQQIFERSPLWPRPDRIPLVRIEDRHGNIHRLSYDSEGHLNRVTDHANRYLEFKYGDCGLVELVVDHTGRQWNYLHDPEIEHLVAVTTPATPEYPQGLTTNYEYDQFQSHPALQHNLSKVIDPAGQVVVENQYGDDPASEDFGRVVYQMFGGFEAYFSATRLQYVPRVPEAVNIPALRVEVIDPGVLHVYTFNYRGDLLDERFRLVYDGSYRLVTRTYRFDEQGNLIERREPNGLGLRYTYDQNNSDPRARGNLLKVELIAPPTQSIPSRITHLLTYEPQFNRLKTIQDEKGKVTTWIYDFELGLENNGDPVQIEYPDAILPDGTKQSRREEFSYNTFGQLIEHRTGAAHRHIFNYFSSGPEVGYLQEIVWDVDGVNQSESFEYNVYGRRSVFIDGLGNRSEFIINALGQITSQRFPAIDGVIDEVRFFYNPTGQVRREEWPRGEYNDAILADPFITNEYTYDTLGYLSETVLGSNTANPRFYRYKYNAEGKLLEVNDPLNRRTVITYDERNLLLTLTEAAGTTVEAIWHYTYDHNGNRIAALDPVGHRFDYNYDAWDRLEQMTLPGAPDSERTRLDLTLNYLDRIERIQISGLIEPGITGNLLESTIEYDARGRPWRRTIDNRTTIFTYDADERVVSQTDQRGNNLRLVYDGLNRIIQLTDAAGNSLLRSYDPGGNLINLQSQEQLSDGSGTEVFITKIDYDSRHRSIRFISPLGQVSLRNYDARNYPVRETSPLGQHLERSFGLQGELLSVTTQIAPGQPATHRFLYDLMGRQIAYTDPEGHQTTYNYDARDRRTDVIYPDGRRHRFFYDLHLQIIREETPGGTVKNYTYGPDAGLTSIEYLPGPGLAPTPALRLFQDGMRRAVRLEQGGAVLERVYDASLRLIRETSGGRTVSLNYDDLAGQVHLIYPDGRVDLWKLDKLGRITTVEFETPGTDGLTGALIAGTVLAKYNYGGMERITRRELVNGVATEIEYDAGQRLTSILHKDPKGNRLVALRYIYDSGDRKRIVWSESSPQDTILYDYDGLDRLRVAALGLVLPEPNWNLSQAAADVAISAAATVTPLRSERYILNQSDARLAVELVDSSGTSTETYTLNSTYEISQIDRVGAGGASWPFIYDGDGNCVQDQRFHYTYNAIGQLVEVRELSSLKVVLSQEFDPAGRVLRRTEDGASYEQTHLGFRVLQRQDLTGGTGHIQYTYGLGVDEILVESDGTNRYPLQDLASNLLAYTDSTGVAVERYGYTPFGEVSVWSPDGITPRPGTAINGTPRFGGHPLLKCGLYDARARVYDPHIGGFLQPDPLGYVNSPDLYSYTHHDPVNYVDPTGEAGLLLGLAVAAAFGLVIGAGTNAIHQAIQIHEGSKQEFSLGELALSAGIGAVMGPLLVFAPELAIPLAVYGVATGAEEISQGYWESGLFDIGTSLLPFAFKGVRSATFGRGSAFAPSRRLGPSATRVERVGRFPEIGRSTKELTGRRWNVRFYRGTTYYEALEAEQNNALDIRNVRERQVLAEGKPTRGPGLYFSRELGAPWIEGSPRGWANYYGNQFPGGGGPAVMDVTIPRWRLFLLKREPGVEMDVPQRDYNHPATIESFFPFEGPIDQPPGGPGAQFNTVARWKVWDPNTNQPSLNSLWPALATPSVRWPWQSQSTSGRGFK